MVVKEEGYSPVRNSFVAARGEASNLVKKTATKQCNLRSVFWAYQRKSLSYQLRLNLFKQVIAGRKAPNQDNVLQPKV
jgi:hypothetical protein